METVKIVSPLKDGTDQVDLFGGFHHAIVLQGKWHIRDDRNLEAFVDSIHYSADKMIFTEGVQPKHGDRQMPERGCMFLAEVAKP
jgi:hypothetical protein